MANGIITTGSAPKTLWPGVYAFWGQKYAEHGLLCKELFETKTSTKAYEETPELIGFGLAPKKEQGTSTQYATWRQGNTPRYTNDAYSLGFIVTHEEIKDNQYEQVVMDRTERLAFSMRTTKEIVAANIYNRGFNSSFVMTGGDGKELLATDHPTDSGDFSNELAISADLSEASLEDLLIQIRNTTDAAGLKINLRATKLIVAPANMFIAERILGSALQNDTANNAINAVRSMSSVSGGFVSNPYLTDGDAWFLRTDAPSGMCNFEREAIDFSDDNDFDTKNMKHSAYERYTFGWSDPRGIFGSPGA